MWNIKYLEQLLYLYLWARYACICTGYMDIQFLKNKQIQPWIWFRYLVDILFIFRASKKEFSDSWERLNNFHPNLKFTLEYSRGKINFFNITIEVNRNEFITDLYCKPTDDRQYIHFPSCYPSHIKPSIFFVTVSEWEEFVLGEVILLLTLKSLRIVSRKWSKKKHRGCLEILYSVVLKNLKEVYQIMVELRYS